MPWSRTSDARPSKAWNETPASVRIFILTYREFLAARTAELQGSETPFLDASLILAASLGIPRSSLLARLPEPLDAPPEGFDRLWGRRLAGESVSYILGRREFFGREFLVDARVLSPRPDTEVLVAAALELGDSLGMAQIRVHDLCTGSGAVVISLVAERPFWRVSASDLSAEALEVAAANSLAILGRTIPLRQADLLEGIAGPFDLITANPPYVPSAEASVLLEGGWGEPLLALDGGTDGLDLVRRLAVQAPAALARGGFLLVEIDALQAAETRSILEKEDLGGVRIWKDLAGRERVVSARFS
ncbi:MAG: peptide chain release factor N(5)-glutamine methyltransferase [Spirochaetes bacterium]|nr:peptide chain release factor N(5)-glutamine methyltransferase [Spirochaetota bacterium]